jgi:hypothetical protein
LALIGEFSRELAAIPASGPSDTPIGPQPRTAQPRDRVDA